jgi:hypothetical protein
MGQQDAWWPRALACTGAQLKGWYLAAAAAAPCTLLFDNAKQQGRADAQAGLPHALDPVSLETVGLDHLGGSLAAGRLPLAAIAPMLDGLVGALPVPG